MKRSSFLEVRHDGSRRPRWAALSPVLALFLLLSLAPMAVVAGSSDPGLPLGSGVALVADEQAEANYHPTYLSLATGDPRAEHSTYGWPFALESIGHAIQSYQYYGGSPYFHHGLDIMAPSGTNVYNRSGGQIVNIENYQPGNDLYWEIAVKDPEGYLWQYHHIDHNTIPQYIWNKWAEYQIDPGNGGFVPPDTLIGNIVWWPVGYPGAPSNFHHIHLNILGTGGAFINGFEFHTSLSDTQSPQILAVGLLKNNQIYPGNQVSGTYGLYVHARDLVLAPNWYWLPPFETTFTLDGGPLTTVWRFDTLPGGADDYAFVSDFYVVPPTCGDYDCNEFYIDLGFTTFGQRPFPSVPGQHTLTATVKDFAGNAASQAFTWTVIPEMSMHVGDLDRLTAWNLNGTWRATATITVHNFNEGLVYGATVSGRWRAGSGTDGTILDVTCTTNTLGKCSIVKRKILSTIPYVQFKVTGVTGAGYTYYPPANHDPDGDSNGTLITINKP